MVRPVVRDFMTGITALVGLFGLVLMLLLFGEISDLGEKFYTFKVHVNSAGGLSGTSAVTLNGVKVGKVESTRVVPPPGSGAELMVRIKEGNVIPKVARITIDKSLVGEATLEFAIPPDAPVSAMTDTIAAGSTFEGGDASSTLSRLAAAIEKPLARFSSTADGIDKMAATYTTLGERIHELVEPRTLADVESGKPPNIRSAVARADLALAGAGKLLGDEQLVAQIKGVVDKASHVMDEASSLSKAWTTTAANLDQQVNKVSGSVETLTAQATGTLRNTEKAAAELAQVLETVNKGDGTVGQLVQNPDLYNSLRDAAQRMERALAEFQLMVQKYRAEGIPLHL